MAAFRDTLELLHLHDMGFSGPKFTWNNGRDPHIEYGKDLIEQWQMRHGAKPTQEHY